MKNNVEFAGPPEPRVRFDPDRSSLGMGETPDQFGARRLSNCHRLARAAGAMGILVGFIVLVGGWGLGVGPLRNLLPEYSAMRPNTAFGIVLLGAALFFDQVGQGRADRIRFAAMCARTAGLIGLLTLIGNVTGTHSLDGLLFGKSLNALAPGDMSSLTAVSLMLLGCGMPMCWGRRLLSVGQYLVIAAGGMSAFSVIGYLYGVKSVYHLAFQREANVMAIHTALTLTILCVGAILSRPEWGVASTITTQWPGGVLARRLLPAALVVPVIATWLRSEALMRGIYDTGFRLAVFTSINIIALVVLIWRMSKTLNRLHKTRIDADKTLRESEGKFRALLESAPDAMVIGDDKGRIILVNSRAEALFGYSRRELLGEKAEMLIPLGGDLAAEQMHPTELEGRRKDGTRFPAEITKSPIATPHGAWVCNAIREITERKRIEQLIAERKHAEDANVAKSEFLAAMSHEIRTPMNAILGMADLLWESKLDADQMQYVDVFRRAGSGLLSLINDILDLSKVESGHLDLEDVEFDLEEVVDQAIELTMGKARAKGLLLLRRLVPGVATLLTGDPTRLKQILINLLGNAVKFTESGGVVLTVQNCASGNSGEIEFTVSDSGIGIPQSKLETIFDDFTQGDASTTRKYGGTGLGLGISRRLVESMNGRLTASSVSGEGSTFRFTAHFGPAAAGRVKSPVELPDIYGWRVMVIDSDEISALILRETLRSWGLESDVFASSQSAADSIAQEMSGAHPYSLVFVDDCVPGADGFEVAARIKKIAPQVPVVMLTSDTRPGDALRRKEARLSAYAVKPVKRADLLRLVSATLKHQEGRDAGQRRRTDDKTAKSVRVLVAEDSSDNRLLVQAYLRSSPHLLTFVEDGKAAVDRFTPSEFDLILMDMQMPIMDGLTATRAIRAIERERGSPPVPIIALTANARPQDVETSRNAGCNHHVTKPISKRELLTVIEEYGSQMKTAENTASTSLPAIMIEMPTGLEEIVPAYLESRRAEVTDLLALLASSDFKRLAMLGHNLKGSGASYGFPEITRIGGAVEHSAHQSDAESLCTQLAELKEYLGQVELCARV